MSKLDFLIISRPSFSSSCAFKISAFSLEVNGPFFNNNSKTQIFYAGNNISPNYLNDLFKVIEGKNVSVNVISKSGTTTEPSAC